MSLYLPFWPHLRAAGPEIFRIWAARLGVYFERCRGSSNVRIGPARFSLLIYYTFFLNTLAAICISFSSGYALETVLPSFRAFPLHQRSFQYFRCIPPLVFYFQIENAQHLFLGIRPSSSRPSSAPLQRPFSISNTFSSHFCIYFLPSLRLP